jgi:hypothetical protein
VAVQFKPRRAVATFGDVLRKRTEEFLDFAVTTSAISTR